MVLYLRPPRSKYAAFYLAPFAALAIWFFALWHTTGHVFGDPGFTQYNTLYSLNPVRASLTLLRRFYYLFVDDFRWVGTLAILFVWRREPIFATRAWKIVWCFIAAHVLLVSLLGGAGLERYLLPVLPLVYIAMAAAFAALHPPWRIIGATVMAMGLLAGLFLNPPFPMPFENNLAMADFVELHRDAAQFLEKSYPEKTVYTAWPLTQALRDPAFGYVDRKLSAAETSDLRVSTLNALDPKGVDVLVLYSRTWEPSWGVLQWAPARDFLQRFYEYERQMTPAEVSRHFGLVSGASLDPARAMDRGLRPALTRAALTLVRDLSVHCVRRQIDLARPSYSPAVNENLLKKLRVQKGRKRTRQLFSAQLHTPR